MICFDVYEDKLDWLVHCFVAVTPNDESQIINTIYNIGATKGVVDRVRNNVSNGKLDTGFTYSNRSNRESVMVIGSASSSKEAVNSIVHELRHLIDDISSTDKIALCGEKVAYLSGDLAMIIASKLENFLCCECHKHKKSVGE